MKTLKSVMIIVSIILIISCNKNHVENLPKGDYLGDTPPADSAKIFAEDVISTQYNERDITFSPDGKDVFFSLKGAVNYALIHMERDGNVWLKHKVAPFSGRYSDLEPCFSPDGKRLYFASNRPINDNDPPKDYDIWYVTKTDSGWSDPINPGIPLNSDANEFYPSLSKNGKIYFCARSINSIGGEDLFYSELINGEFTSPINLGDSINSPGDEFNALISPNDDFIIYGTTGYGRGYGGGDLWISFRNNENTWGKPINMGPTINSASLEYCPSLSPDGKYLFFTSNRGAEDTDDPIQYRYEDIIKGLNSSMNGSQNIYWVSSNIINELKNEINK